MTTAAATTRRHAPQPAAGSARDRWYAQDRLGGLRRFAIAITVLNILGHTWFGFEQSFAHPLVALATTYTMELLLETVDALAMRRRPRFVGGLRQWVDFLLPAHISGLAVSMLLYPGDRLMPVVFAGAVAMGSKSVFRMAISGRSRHLFNPSNLGITATLLCFPWVGIAPPYQFTENLYGIGDWILPGIIVCSGTFLNTRFTRRLPLILSWLLVFILQAAIRSTLFDTPFTAGLMPITGVAFLLFTFYMVTDPPTTPSSVRAQIAFGASVAAVYGMLMISEIVFGLFFSLTIVSTIRGVYLWSQQLGLVRQAVPGQAPARTASATPAPAPIPSMLATSDPFHPAMASERSEP